ncbi:hypothetical protein [Paraburkholderia largidicola]|uniref:Lipoprotein n=1 Tax=Paraburkholderia largidicola TaxID=3014751 RepID=A0A7I8BG01_9BURK|nr:hypothetical protein [Paraburkholderia sp. PGU16]BCF87554.1 hypothetical protein PPGU16_06210 [Paraburkholderia sp. PGU16]
MKSLWRILIVLALALLGMQGASACEHHRDASLQAMSVHTNAIHRDTSTNTSDSTSSCHRMHSLCCMTACGTHCGALLSNIGMAMRMASSDLPGADSDPARASVTRAPPVRPPIV